MRSLTRKELRDDIIFICNGEVEPYIKELIEPDLKEKIFKKCYKTSMKAVCNIVERLYKDGVISQEGLSYDSALMDGYECITRSYEDLAKLDENIEGEFIIYDR